MNTQLIRVKNALQVARISEVRVGNNSKEGQYAFEQVDGK